MGRSVIKTSPEPELEMVPGACTCRPQTWGFQPYNALAKELNFGNEQPMECGGLSQAQICVCACRYFSATRSAAINWLIRVSSSGVKLNSASSCSPPDLARRRPCAHNAIPPAPNANGVKNQSSQVCELSLGFSSTNSP